MPQPGHEIPAPLLPTDGAAGSRAAPPAPEPSAAERARTIAATVRRGTLATIAVDGSGAAGYPFASTVNVVADEAGRLLTFLSTMAEHTRNLSADRRASVLLAEEVPEGADPLALGRLTLVGDLQPVEEGERPAVRDAFLEANPQAFYVDYGDFSAVRLEVVAVRWVGGFGRMGWVPVEEYAAAQPDPLVRVAPGAIAHMNADHAGSLAACARAFGGVEDATEASMTALDRYGFDLVAVTPSGRRATRVGFPAPVDDPSDVRVAVVEVVGRARVVLPG